MRMNIKSRGIIHLLCDCKTNLSCYRINETAEVIVENTIYCVCDSKTIQTNIIRSHLQCG